MQIDKLFFTLSQKKYITFASISMEQKSKRPTRKKSGHSNSVWLTNEEHLHFKKIAEEQKTSISSAIKYAALNRKLQVKHKTITKTDPKLLFELNKIGCNINQIAKQLNKMENISNFSSNDIKLIFNNFRIAISDFKRDLLNTIGTNK